MMARMRPTFADCNGNSIADSIDIAAGMEDDVNHNGIADDCDPDTNLCVRRGGRCLDEWKAYASRPDTSYFLARHKWNGTVLIRYTVPPGPHAVRLDALRSGSEASVTIVSAVMNGGSYMLSWDKRGIGETPLPPGTYDLRMTIGAISYSSRVRWE
jgi:hypothetical protein